MIFLCLLCIAIATPRSDFHFLLTHSQASIAIQQKEKKVCVSARSRLAKSTSYLKKVVADTHSPAPSRLFAADLLHYFEEPFDPQYIWDIYLSEYHSRNETKPTAVATHACYLLKQEPRRAWAQQIMELKIRQAWLFPCLELLIDSLDVSQLNYILRESHLRPSANRIQVLLKRKGSSAFLDYLQFFPYVDSLEGLEIMFEVSRSLAPKTVSSQALHLIEKLIRLGPPISFADKEVRKVYNLTYNDYLSRIYLHVTASEEWRMDTPTVQPSYKDFIPCETMLR